MLERVRSPAGLFAATPLLIATALLIGAPPAEGTLRPEEDWTVYGDLRQVHSIAIAPDFVYLGTGGGLARFNRLREEWEPPASVPQGLPDPEVILVGIDALTRLVWTCTPSGIFLYDPAFGSFSPVDTPFSPVNAHSIGFSEEHVSVAVDRTIHRYDRESHTWEKRSGSDEETIWHGTAGSVSLESPAYSFVSPHDFRDPDLNTFPLSTAARDGDELWVGSLGYGVARYSILMLDRTHWLLGPGGADITSLAGDGDAIWAAGSGVVGLMVSRWDLRRNEWTDLPQPMTGEGSDLVATALLPGDRYLWLGTDRGLFAYDNEKSRWKRRLLPGRARDAAVCGLAARGDTLWAATEEGPAWLSTEDWESGLLPIADTTGHEVPDRATFDVAIDESYLWFASDRGIYLYDLEERRWRLLDNPPGLLSTDAFRAILDPRAAQVLFATRRGIAVYDRAEGSWLEALAPGGLTRSIIAAAADARSIWCGTPHELLRFDRKTTSWETLATDEWLEDGRIQALHSSGEYLWCGTPRGLARYDLERILEEE